MAIAHAVVHEAQTVARLAREGAAGVVGQTGVAEAAAAQVVLEAAARPDSRRGEAQGPGMRGPAALPCPGAAAEPDNRWAVEGFAAPRAGAATADH